MAVRTKAKVSENGTANHIEAPSSAGSPIVIARPRTEQIKVKLVGVSSLIVHAWSTKAKRMMLDKQMKKAAKAKEAKNPEQDYIDSLYTSDDGWTGVPSVAFKAAMVGACRQVDGLPMTMAKRCFFVVPDGFSTAQSTELTRIYGVHRMREDMVRLETGTADIRYRAEYPEWYALLTLTFNAALFSREQVVNLLALAGDSEGICEWRPSAPKSATGTHGRWTVE